MQGRLSALLIAAGAALALASCRDPTAIEARLNNIRREFSLYALNGSHPNTINAVRVRSVSPDRANSSFAFDIAFDLTDTGTVKLITSRWLATELAGGINRVGLRDSPDVDFETVVDPPRDRFIYDSLLVVPVGRTVLIDVVETACFTESILGANIKSKMRIDSILPAERQIFVTMVSNPNCGFRELVPGGQKPRE